MRLQFDILIPLHGKAVLLTQGSTIGTAMYALGAPFVVLVWPQTCKNFSLSREASLEFPARTKHFWRETLAETPYFGKGKTSRWVIG